MRSGPIARETRALQAGAPTSYRSREQTRRKACSPGRARHGIVQAQPPGSAERFAQLRYRALHGQSVPVHLFRLS